jgi:hypothetical protein
MRILTSKSLSQSIANSGHIFSVYSVPSVLKSLLDLRKNF